MSVYKFLTTNALDVQSIWSWAKQLVTDLNKRDAEFTSAMSGGIPTGSQMFWHDETPPVGWLNCDGGQYLTADYPLLFLSIGYKYGGAGALFNVPDMRDRILMGAGTLVALNETAGADMAQLTNTQLPSHTHVVDDPGHTHAFTGDAHTHTVTDPGHVHAVTDPGHIHGNGAAAPAAAMTAGAVNAVVAQGNTASAVTGLTVNSGVTGVTNQNTIATGTNTAAATGVSIADTGEGEAFSILNPVFGINVIIKA